MWCCGLNSGGPSARQVSYPLYSTLLELFTSLLFASFQALPNTLIWRDSAFTGLNDTLRGIFFREGKFVFSFGDTPSSALGSFPGLCLGVTPNVAEGVHLGPRIKTGLPAC